MSSNSSDQGTSMIRSSNDQMTNNTLKKELFAKVMKGEWEEVVKIHEQDRRAYKTKITTLGHTAFHLAILLVKKEIVEKLLDDLLMISKRDHNDVDHAVSEAKEILLIGNVRGHTALHMAAAAGSKKMCRCIGGVDKSLVLARDHRGETPLFRAVVYGRRKAFLHLHCLISGDDHRIGDTTDVKKYCLRDDGQTILHNAISMENFDLAFQIIHLYKELVNYADKEGEFPLHALARKSAAFRSGTRYRGRDRILYHCISVKKLEVDYKALEKYSNPTKGIKDKNPNPPENKRSTFLNFIGLLLRNVTQVAGHVKKESCANVDVENREGRIEQTGPNIANQERQHYYSPSYMSYFKYSVKFVCKAILPVVFGYGHVASIKKIQKSKEKHVWAVQVLNELLKHSTMYVGNEELRLIQRSNDQTKGNFHDNSEDDDSRDKDNSDEEFYRDNISESSKISVQPSYHTNISDAAGNEVCSRKETKPNDTPILLAAKYGIAEMVEKILEHFPVAIYDVDKDSKTVLLVAVEKRNLQVYKILIKRYFRKDYVFHKMDEKGNNALHYAAMYDEEIKPWPVPGAALQMQWEIKWHEFVENTMPPRLYLRTNKDGQTPKEMFSHTHKDLVKAGGKWLTSTATSCSVVATLIATVAFASSADAPGGTDNKSGKPTLEKNPTFELFAISSLVALCFSVTSLIMFLAILTSRHQEKDFGEALPRKILLGLTSLFVSIASMLVTFCAGHFLVFEDKIKYAAIPVYAVTLLPLCLFAAAQFPLYFDLLMATFWSPF